MTQKVRFFDDNIAVSTWMSHFNEIEDAKTSETKTEYHIRHTHKKGTENNKSNSNNFVSEGVVRMWLLNEI